jgi:superfamily I DNA/RNA helicase
MKFTQRQLEAINHQDGNLQLIACAGSGKTEVVARRVAALLKKGKNYGLAPRNIVAFTFTDKAAAELKDRIRREVLPCTPDAWLVEADTKIGYEVSFTRHFYQPPQLRTLAQISADILALEQETEGLLHEITKGAAK